MAIECKREGIHYDSLYSEIESLAQKFEFSNLEQTSPVPITDDRLKELLTSKDNLSSPASSTNPEDIYTIAEEDIEYEENDMDDDLESLSSDKEGENAHLLSNLLNALELSGSVSMSAPSSVESVSVSASAAAAAAAHDPIDDSPPLSLSGDGGHESNGDSNSG
jgi:hypothetical protein